MKYIPCFLTILFYLISNYEYQLNAESEIVILNTYVLETETTNSAISQLGRDAIRLDKPLDVADFLSAELSYIDITRKGGIANDILLRGFAGDDITVVIDDCKVFGACPNRMDPPSFHISAQSVNGIEVKKGPFNIRQAGALGGSINLSTANPDYESVGRFSIVSGSNSYFGTSLNYNQSWQDFALRFDYSRQESDPFEDGKGRAFTDLTNFSPPFKNRKSYEIDNWLLRSRFNPGKTNNRILDFSISFDDARGVLYPGLKMDALYDRTWRYALKFTSQVESSLADQYLLSAYYAAVTHDMRDSWRTTSTAANPSLVANAPLLQLVQSRGYMMKTYAETLTSGFRLEFEKDQENRAFWQYGLQVEFRSWNADNEIMKIENDMLPDVSHWNTGLYLLHKRHFGDVTVQGGLRVDQSTTRAADSIAFLENKRGQSFSNPEALNASGYVLIQYNLSDNLDGWVGMGRAVRQPDPQEYFINLNRPGTNPDWLGNPDLKPVKNHEIDLGFTWIHGNLLLESSLFFSDLKDFIYLERLSADALSSDQNPYLSYRNLDAYSYGCDLSCFLRINKTVSITGGWAMQRACKQHPDSPGQSRDLAEIPASKVRLGLSLKWPRWFLKMDYQCYFKQDHIDPDLLEWATPQASLVQLRAGIDINDRWQVLAGVDNLFDRQFNIHNAYLRNPFSSGKIVNEPGRNIFLSLASNF